MKKFRYSSSPSTARARSFLGIAIFCLGVTSCVPQDDTIPKSLNEEHRFELNGCDIRYNNKPLQLGAPVDQWAQVLGPYDRMVDLANDLYVWDDIGIILYVTPNQTGVHQLALIFNLEPDEMPPEVLFDVYNQQLKSGEVPLNSPSYKRIESMKESQILILQSRPRTFFQDGFLLDGVVIDANVDIEALNNARHRRDPELPRFVRRYLPSIYNIEYECPDSKSRATYQINTITTDRSLLRKFEIAIEHH